MNDRQNESSQHRASDDRARQRTLLSLLIAVGSSTLILALVLLCVYTEPAVAALPAASMRLVDEGGVAVAQEQVRILCYATPAGLTPQTDLLYTTDGNGNVREPLSPGCNYVAVLRPIHTQSSGKPGRGDSYIVYHTSWPAGSRALLPAQGVITTSSSYPLVLFDVAAALEWEPAATSSYVADLRAGLLAASGYLYDLTEGQMAFGPLQITTGSTAWAGADLRLRAANDFRPTAQVGGMVPLPISYTTQTGERPVYAPGAIWLGRAWDGRDGVDPVAGSWAMPDAYRTIIHEWLHYALFLYDEYLQDGQGGRADRQPTYCTCVDLPALKAGASVCGGIEPALAASAMAYHYVASELWASGLPDACATTDQHRVHGEPDWTTLAQWPAIQGLAGDWLRPPITATAGPELGLAADLFDRRPGKARFQLVLPLLSKSLSGGAAPAQIANSDRMLAANQDVSVTLALTATNLPGVLRNLTHPQLYTFSTISATVSMTQVRILHQGTTVGNRDNPDGLGEALLLGVASGDRLKVAVDLYSTELMTGVRFVYPSEGEVGTLPQDTSTPLRLGSAGWDADLNLDFGMDGPRLAVMTVTVTSRTPLTQTPVAMLCSQETLGGCSSDPAWTKPLSAQGALTWTTSFTPTTAMTGTMPPTITTAVPLPSDGQIWLQAPGVGEMVRWFLIPGGVGPAHADAHAPLRDGPIMVDATQPISGAANRFGFMPAASASAVRAPLPVDVDAILGQPLDLDVILPGNLPNGSGDHLLPVPISLTFFYSQVDVERVDADESSLSLLHFNRNLGSWQTVAVTSRNDVLDWVNSGPLSEDGIYAIGMTFP